MIELRWLSESGEKRLQYRTGEIDPFGMGIVCRWSDWQDVPAVEAAEGGCDDK